MLKQQPGVLTQRQIDLLNVARLVGSDLPNHALRFLDAHDVARLQELGLLEDVSPRVIPVPWDRSCGETRPGS